MGGCSGCLGAIRGGRHVDYRLPAAGPGSQGHHRGLFQDEAAGLTKGQQITPMDEMRLGLKGVMRRVWCSRGVKAVQRLQFVFAWIDLVVAADPCSGKLGWQWIAGLNPVHLLPVIQHWGLDGLIGDNA